VISCSSFIRAAASSSDRSKWRMAPTWGRGAPSRGLKSGALPLLVALTVGRGLTSTFPGMIPEIDIWRVADLMLQRYGDEADIESAIRAEELAEAGDWAGEAIWRRIINAIGQLENTTPPGLLH
jgi:hypothetical protein